MTWKKEYQGKW